MGKTHSFFKFRRKVMLSTMKIQIRTQSLFIVEHVDFLQADFFGGGSKGDLTVLIITRLDGESFEWTKIEQLNDGRRAHNTIYLNGYFIVVGGRGIYETEKCMYNNNQMTCYSQSPSLHDYAYAPQLMLVPDDYCN